MLFTIRNSQITSWMARIILVSIAFSFLGSFIGNKTDQQKVLSSPIVKNDIPRNTVRAFIPKESKAVKISQPISNEAPVQASPSPSVGTGTAFPEQPAAATGEAVVTPSRQSNGNEADIYLLARVINAEARGEPFEGQVAVGAVLLNRLHDSRFPKTLAEIIFKQGEFCTVRDGQVWMSPSQQAIKAARLASAGWDPTGGAVYFYNPAKTTSRWIWSRPVVQRIGNHIFAV